jgi:hypothetical protein
MPGLFIIKPGVVLLFEGLFLSRFLLVEGFLLEPAVTAIAKRFLAGMTTVA